MLGDEEKRAVLEVLDGTTLTHGPLVRRFEADFAAYTGAEHAVATSSCMAALHLACIALGLGPGDEVLVSAQTHVATAHAVELCGARPVFVDCDPETGNVDPERLRSAITRHCRAIALVHYLGFPADIRRIVKLAERHGLAVIEDCALALGATADGRHVGTWGDAGCFSFYPAKHITTGEGGMLITRRRDLAEKAARLRAFGIDRNVVHERALPGTYDVPGVGLNYRMNEMSAALGIRQLRRLPEFLGARRRNYARLAAGLAELERVAVLGAGRSVEHSACYCLVLMLDAAVAARRTELMLRLGRDGVGCSVYYPAALPCMSYYRETYHTGESTAPNAAHISNASIALPVGPHVGPDDVDYIVARVRAAVKELRA